jgi:hypothetical protein
MASSFLNSVNSSLAFRVYGKAKPETDWRVIDVYASGRRNIIGGGRFVGGTCITWSSRVVAVGWDFAAELLREQMEHPASRAQPVEIAQGRLRFGRTVPAEQPFSEILAHECGHTYQAVRLGLLYLPTGALFTWWREGPHWWNRFENMASERGQFGGIVTGSVCKGLWDRVTPPTPPS